MTYQFKEEAGRMVALDGKGKEAGEVRFTREDDNVLSIDHTEVYHDFRGQGLGGRIIEQVVKKAKNEDLKVKPICPYAKKQFEDHEEYQVYMQD